MSKGRYKTKDQIVKRIDRLTQLIISHEAQYQKWMELRETIIHSEGPELEKRSELDKVDDLATACWKRIQQCKSKRKRAGERLSEIQTPVLLACSGEDGSVPR